MNAIDTNVLLYRVDRFEAIKRKRARDLFRTLAAGEPKTVLLWQVAVEFMRQLRRWEYEKRISTAAVREYVAATRSRFSLVMPNPAVLDLAIDLPSRHGLSHWDAMIVGACIDAGVTTLYTEDMGAPRQIETVQLINPFQ